MRESEGPCEGQGCVSEVARETVDYGSDTPHAASLIKTLPNYTRSTRIQLSSRTINSPCCFCDQAHRRRGAFAYTPTWTPATSKSRYQPLSTSFTSCSTRLESQAMNATHGNPNSLPLSQTLFITSCVLLPSISSLFHHLRSCANCA